MVNLLPRHVLLGAEANGQSGAELGGLSTAEDQVILQLSCVRCEFMHRKSQFFVHVVLRSPRPLLCLIAACQA